MAAANILVVEDNPADVELLRYALEAQNEEFALQVCTDGEEALDVINSQHKGQARPCVIVLDLNLPGHSGFELLHAIREEPLLNHVSVMALSGLARKEDEEKLRALGAHYRQKPMRLPELSELAADLIAICKGLQIAD